MPPVTANTKPDTRAFKQVVTPTRNGFQIAQGETTHKNGQNSSPEAAVHQTTEAEGHGGEREPGEIPEAPLLLWNSALVVVILVALALVARRSLQRIPRGIGNIAELYAEFINNNLTVAIIGPAGVRYTPLVGTIFIYILLMNLIGVLPGFHSPTANLSITLALGLVVFFYVQYEGIRQNGIAGYLKHFAGPMPALSPLMFLIEVISEIVKPFTLAIRLFGNIFGEDVIIIVLAGLALKLGGTALGWIPTQLPVLLLSLLTALVQAMVFSMLTCIYLSLVSHHDHEGAHGEGDAGDGAHHGHAHATGH